MNAVDPQPHPSGVDKTWYANVVLESEDKWGSCYNPQDSCQPVLDSPYNGENTECINRTQDYCTENLENDDWGSWEDCVEKFVYKGCGVSQDWKLYRGEPISKDEESCHVLQFFSVDNVGNTEEMNTNCFFVDKTQPEIEKTVGDPKLECEEDQECDYFIGSNTPITLTCEDVGDHPSNDVTIFWQYRVDEGNGFGDWKEFSENSNKVEFTFPENSMHELEYWCVDAVGKESPHYTEFDKVDGDKPIIEKLIVGPQYGDCPPNPDSNDKCYIIPGETEIQISAFDVESIHSVDKVSCKWGYDFDGKFFGWYTPEGTEFSVTFNEDSEHKLHVVCTDGLGNETEDVELFYVDDTPPITTKKYGDPFYSNDLSEWITSTTPISLTAEDAKVGVDKTYYSVTLLDNDSYCLPQEDLVSVAQGNGIPVPLGCDAAVGSDDDDFTEYDGNAFMIEEESCHLIEFYSVDKLGNEEIKQRQCPFVDNSPPKGVKLIGAPHVVKDESGQICSLTSPLLVC